MTLPYDPRNFETPEQTRQRQLRMLLEAFDRWRHLRAFEDAMTAIIPGTGRSKAARARRRTVLTLIDQEAEAMLDALDELAEIVDDDGAS